MKDDVELEEVERALSVLGGRHPEHVKAERETAAATARRLAEQRQALAKERAHRRRRLALLVVSVVVVAGVGAALVRFRAARAALDAEVEPVVTRYVALGFDALPRTTFAKQDQAELTTVAGDCYALVAARGMLASTSSDPRDQPTRRVKALVCTCGSREHHREERRRSA